MTDFGDAFAAAFALVGSLDPDLTEIVVLSLRVSIGAVAIGAIIGLPLGAAVALYRFPGRTVVVVALNALMGLPPVVVGLIVYLLLSRAGPFGVFGLLFTPTAMIVAQVVLVTPIIAALSRQVVEDLWVEYEEQLRSLGAGPSRALTALLWDGRFTLVTAVLAGFGRASAEVGAVMMPAMPGWYHGVKTLRDLIDFIVGRILDQLGIQHSLMRRWGDAGGME